MTAVTYRQSSADGAARSPFIDMAPLNGSDRLLLAIASTADHLAAGALQVDRVQYGSVSFPFTQIDEQVITMDTDKRILLSAWYYLIPAGVEPLTTITAVMTSTTLNNYISVMQLDNVDINNPIGNVEFTSGEGVTGLTRTVLDAFTDDLIATSSVARRYSTTQASAQTGGQTPAAGNYEPNAGNIATAYLSSGLGDEVVGWDNGGADPDLAMFAITINSVKPRHHKSNFLQ